MVGRTRRIRSAREPRTRRRWVGLGVVAAVVLAVVIPAITAANVVPVSRASDSSHPVTVNQLKPPACAGLNLVNLFIGGNNGGTGNDLVLGTAGGDTMNGGPGDDCLVGGDGDDQLNGGPGTDVCLGQGGVDAHRPQCEQTDGA